MSGPDYLLSKHLSAQEHYQSLNQQSVQQYNPAGEPTISIESGLSKSMIIHSADQREHYTCTPGEVHLLEALQNQSNNIEG